MQAWGEMLSAAEAYGTTFLVKHLHLEAAHAPEYEVHRCVEAGAQHTAHLQVGRNPFTGAVLVMGVQVALYM
jgi:hypothetical protein